MPCVHAWILGECLYLVRLRPGSNVTYVVVDTSNWSNVHELCSLSTDGP